MTDDGHRFLQVILVGVDGSDGSRRALDWTVQLARATGASVHAVHVLTYNREFLRDISLDTMRTWRRDLDHDLERTWTAPLITHDIPHRTTLVEDRSPAAGLLAVADREQVGLIVVGAAGQGGLAGRVLGSTSYALTHQAQRPVIVVPATWQRPAHTE